MAVIINEFEVVVEPPPVAAPQRNTAAEVQPPSEAPTPLDIERIVVQQLARQARLRAH